MEISAVARNRNTGIRHDLTKSKLTERQIKATTDGGLAFEINVNMKTGMSGEYIVKFELSSSEAILLAQRALQAPLEARLREANIKFG